MALRLRPSSAPLALPSPNGAYRLAPNKPEQRLATLDQAVDPAGERVQHLRSDLGIAPSSACGHVEGMIAVGDLHQRCAPAELGHELAHERESGERVARTLKEEHRDLHLEEMRRALLRRTTRGVQRKAEECQAAHAGKRRFGLRLRGHAAAEGFAAGDKWKLGNAA